MKVLMVQAQSKKGKAARLGGCTYTLLQQSPPQTTYTSRRNQQTRCTAPPECGILVLRSKLGVTHRTAGGALASGWGRA